MPASKAQVLENLGEVKNLGPTYAERAYDELGVRNIDDLIQAAEGGKLQSIKGIGAAKEKSILKSARDLAKAEGKPAPAPAPEAKAEAASKKPAKKATTKKADAKPAKATSTKKEPAKKASKSVAKDAQTSSASSTKAKQEPKPTSPKPEATRADAARAEAKAATPKSSPSNGASSERPRTTYRPPAASKGRPSIPGLIFKLGKKIIGRILG